jgi:hypothetical protein
MLSESGKFNLSIIVLIILLLFSFAIVLVLNKFTLKNVDNENEKISRIDDKINWLFYLFSIALVIIMFLITRVVA